MLRINESITIVGESKIEDKVVVSMVANITTDGANFPNMSNTVLDKELYADNIEVCQTDILEFSNKVLEKQRLIFGGTQ